MNDNPTEVPLTCRWHIRHHWIWARTEDGDPYQRCIRCGTDRTESVGNGTLGRGGYMVWWCPWGM
jgi:hypothetical protein